jgi:hypothetical protein
LFCVWDGIPGHGSKDCRLIASKALPLISLPVSGRGELVALEAVAGYAERHLVPPGSRGWRRSTPTATFPAGTSSATTASTSGARASGSTSA